MFVLIFEQHLLILAYLTIKVNANLIEVVKLHKNNVLKLCEMPKVIIRENK